MSRSSDLIRGKDEEDLQESEDRYRGLADVAFDGVAVHSGGILLQASQSFDKLFGYENGTMMGLSIYDLVVEDQRDYFRRELDHDCVIELECLREDGRRFDVEASTRSCKFRGEPAFALAVRDISVRKKHLEIVRHQADFDGLTGLPNRALFYDRLCNAIERAAQKRSLLAVLFLDLDRFKNVNDALGHNVGDLLLFEVAERLSACLRTGDTVSRLGGDEFTILLKDVLDGAEVGVVAERIVRSVNTPYLIHEQSISIGVSVGIALYPEHGEQADGLIRAADAAMYHAKDDGRNQFKVYRVDQAAQSSKLALESRLRQGIENKEFVNYYQPRMDLSSGLLEGAEVLVRWNHAERGLVMPDDFIPLAEETLLILPLGAWILNDALRRAKAWEGASLKVSINLSPMQLYDAALLDTIDAAMKSSGANPEGIEFEVTETAAMKNMARSLAVLTGLSSRGFGVSLDDFGKGYSSLNYLKQFPVSTIKIDIAFIRDVLKEAKDAAIVRAIIVLAHNLGMKVLAEGVEVEGQADFLRLEGCDYAQGYLYSRPIPAGDFEKRYASQLPQVGGRGPKATGSAAQQG
jgi:diguanylate cyclase (GGDEF)-like protein/PAS domain S-box-containing protein